MTYEEVLENIKANICYNQPMCSDGICKSTEENPCTIDIALECIDKQIPMKPQAIITEIDTMWHCSECGKFICYEDEHDYKKHYTHCPSGHRIDWSDE